MDIKDRGIMKWQGFFMPEHVAQLNQLRIDGERTAKPILDEYQLQEIDEKLHIAIEFQYPVEFTLWFDGFTDESEGVIHYLDEIKKQVRIKNYQGEVTVIDYKSIIDVNILD